MVERTRMMVDRTRIIQEFIALTSIDRVSRCERQIADALKDKLTAMGLPVQEDGAGEKIGGNAGNVICHVKGKEGIPPVLLMAHMDTVVPGIGKKPVMDGGIIRSDGTTVLGGDDAAGIVSILEALRVLKETKAEHGDIYIVFTVAEEAGLLGSKYLDCSMIPAAYGIVLDGGGPIGHVVVSAPSQNNMDVVVKGKATHAGMEPEKGVSAIQIASKAIAGMRLGRLDHETTANIGIIQGGTATNIVCDRVNIKAEARSRDEEKLELQTRHMQECFEQAASDLGGSVECHIERLYPAYRIREDDEIIGILRKAAEKLGIGLVLEASGGGSDANIMNGRGIRSIDISVGMSKPHSVEEFIAVDDLVKTAAFVVEIIKTTAAGGIRV